MNVVLANVNLKQYKVRLKKTGYLSLKNTSCLLIHSCANWRVCFCLLAVFSFAKIHKGLNIKYLRDKLIYITALFC